MAQQKTRPTRKSVSGLIGSIEDARKRKDCRMLVKIMRKATGAPPRIWGPGMIGFGRYHYRYASGHEGDFFLAGFAPRKTALALYVNPCYKEHDALLKKLGKVKTGKACIYVKSLEDIDPAVLEKMVSRSVRELKRMWS